MKTIATTLFIAAAQAGIRVNADYDEQAIVDPDEARRLEAAMDKLNKTLESAVAAKETQDIARRSMLEHFQAGEAAMEEREWDTAVASFQAGLTPELRKGVNGEKGFDYCWILQPFFDFWRSNSIIDDALQRKLSSYDCYDLSLMTLSVHI